MKLRPAILIATAFFCMISYSSCVKKYICHCDLSYSGYPGLPDSTYKEFDVTNTKSTAKSTCEKESGTYQNGQVTTVEKCYLY